MRCYMAGFDVCVCVFVCEGLRNRELGKRRYRRCYMAGFDTRKQMNQKEELQEMPIWQTTGTRSDSNESIYRQEQDSHHPHTPKHPPQVSPPKQIHTHTPKTHTHTHTHTHSHHAHVALSDSLSLACIASGRRGGGEGVTLLGLEIAVHHDPRVASLQISCHSLTPARTC